MRARGAGSGEAVYAPREASLTRGAARRLLPRAARAAVWNGYFRYLRWRERRRWDAQWRSEGPPPFWYVEGARPAVRASLEEGWISPPGRLLDIGCGVGQGAAWLACAGFDVTGVDFSPSAVAGARRRFGSISSLAFVEEDVCGRTAIPGPFDVLVDSGCLHIIAPGVDAGYRGNVLGWSRPGTRAIVIMHGSGVTLEARRRQIESVFLPEFDIADVAPERADPGAPAGFRFRLIRRG